MKPLSLNNHVKVKRLSMQLLMGTICLFCYFFPASKAMAGAKIIIGETAWIQVAQLPFPFLARIDTGARTTSIHATDIQISDASTVAHENIGKTISFKTVNRDGTFQTLTTDIVQVSTIRNSQGIEQRYVIELRLSYQDKQKKVLVNLRDRSQMKYKLLIGRNWLAGDFLVDVDLKAEKK